MDSSGSNNNNNNNAGRLKQKLKLPSGVGNGIGSISPVLMDRQQPVDRIPPPLPTTAPPPTPPPIQFTLANVPPRLGIRQTDSPTLQTTSSPMSSMNSLSRSTPDLNSKRALPPPQLKLVPPPPLPSSNQATDTMAGFKAIKESDLQVVEELGMGSGGTVHRVLHRPSGVVMAKKIIHEVQMSKEVMRELQILNQCNSPDIVSFYGYYDDGQQICICMEFMDVGSLERVCSVAGKIAEPYLGKIAVSVLRGLAYLYRELRIVHRDIKPSNILLNSRGEVKICDFGVSGKAETSQIGTFVGTGAYMSPERIQGQTYKTQCDSWSLGLTLMELAMGRYPFTDNNRRSVMQGIVEMPIFELLQHIVNDPIPRLPARNFTPSFCQFIDLSLTRDPDRRPTPLQLLDHPFARTSQQSQVDMQGWARSFLEPNLNQRQINRLSMAKQVKRQRGVNVVSLLGEAFDEMDLDKLRQIGEENG